MRKSMKVFKCIICSLCVLIIVISYTDVAFAKQTFRNEETEYLASVEDYADLYNASEEAALINRMQEITQYCNVALVTINQNDKLTTYKYAEQKSYDMFGEESSVLFVIDMECREIYIWSTGAAYNKVTTGMANIITDNVYPYASDGDYFKCADVAFSQIFDLLGGKAVPQPMKFISNFFIAAILAVLANYVLVLFTSRRVVSPRSKLKNGVETKFEVINVSEEVVSSEDKETKTAFEKMVELAEEEEKVDALAERRTTFEEGYGTARGTFFEPNRSTYSELEALFEDEDSIFGENGLFGEFLSGDIYVSDSDYNHRRSSYGGSRSSSRISGRSSSGGPNRSSSRSSYSSSRSSSRSSGRSSSGGSSRSSSRSSSGRSGGGGHRF